MAALNLPTVTLCAATSVNVAATIAALRSSLDQATFADCCLFTDADVTDVPKGIRIVPIKKMASAQAYSDFILNHLADHIRTSHCLVVQWDGFVLDAGCWDPRFLDFDYIGAPWPQFDDAGNVGNGGFSLRSRKLLAACQGPAFRDSHPEDIAICRVNRTLLETRHGIRFADTVAAERFSFERSVPGQPTFGFHGIFNLIPLMGADRFWQVYRTLDDPSTALVDFGAILRQLGSGRSAMRRRARLTLDRLLGLFVR